MHYKLTEDEYRSIGRHAGVSEVVVRRLCRSQYVVVQKESEGGLDSGPQTRLQLGLRVEDGDSDLSEGPPIPKDDICREIARAVRSYMNSCPVVFQWIGRGDYNPLKVPGTIPLPHLIHAARTAGRLRSQLARALTSPKVDRKDPPASGSIDPADKA